VVAKRHGVSVATIYIWRKKFVCARPSHIDRRCRSWLRVRLRWLASGAAVVPQSDWPAVLAVA
jgi:hypothetical protein